MFVRHIVKITSFSS